VKLSRASIACVPLLVLGSALVACLGATEIVLDVRTDAPCASAATWQGVAISIGQPGVDVESRAPVLTTTACGTGGEIGSLVVVPTGASDAEVGIRVVAGITRKPEDCSANAYDGCIVSRRTLTYLPHQSQHVVVDLTSDCIGNACDINHTCVDGSCTDIVTATAPIAPDGGVYNPPPTVRCGDDGTRCPVNDPSLACCVTFDFTAGTGKGVCIPPAQCPSTSAVLYCDDSSECGQGDASDPIICSEFQTGGSSPRVTSTACQPRSQNVQGLAPTLCQDRNVCPGTQSDCYPDQTAPGYYSCGS
jgi:hypothetical protein